MQDEHQISIDISNYLKLKEEGSARIIKVNGVTHYAMRRFDPSTGQPIPQLIQMTKTQVTAQRDSIAAGLKALDAVLTDIDQAQEV